MRNLSAGLLAAQKAASGAPLVRAVVKNAVRGLRHLVFAQTTSDGSADDKHGAPAENSLVVEPDGAAKTVRGRIVVHLQTGRGFAAAAKSRTGGSAPGVRIGLQEMTADLVKEYAGRRAVEGNAGPSRRRRIETRRQGTFRRRFYPRFRIAGRIDGIDSGKSDPQRTGAGCQQE